MSRLFKTSIKENRQLIKNYYLLTIHPFKKIVKPKPGQFFMLSVDKGLDPLLKRPFSLYRWLGSDFQILYRVVGKATSILKDKKPGDVLEIMGPLGNAFPGIKSKIKMILVAGGLGVAPLFALSEMAANKKPLFFLGARTKEEVLCIKELQSLGLDPIVSTDDGSFGQKGLITDVLKEFLTHHGSTEQFDPEGFAKVSPLITHHYLYACGPRPMLKELSLLAKDYKLKGYVSLEENMACGIGACMGCVINTRDGFKRVCKEGPVFPIEDIVW